MELALEHMKTKYGVRPTGPHTARRSTTSEKRKSSIPAEESDEPIPRKHQYMRPFSHAPVTPTASSSRSAGSSNAHSPPSSKKKQHTSTIQEDIKATPAMRAENQPLVDQLVQLGEYELHSGRTQRGIARMRAAKQLHDTTEVIKSGAQAKRLDRIGASAAEKIDVILHEGLRGALKEYSADDDEGGGDSEDEVEKEARRIEEEQHAENPGETDVQQSAKPRGDRREEGDEEEEEEVDEEDDEEDDEEYRDEEEDEEDDEEEESQHRYLKKPPTVKK